MRATLLMFILLLIFCTACKSSYDKKNLTQEDHFKMVIEDYYNENNDYIKMYNTFRVEDRSISHKGYYLYNILPLNNEYSFGISDGWSYLPSGYIKYKDKVFFLIEDENKETKEPSEELLQYLHSVKQLDSTGIKISLGLLKEEDAPLIIDIFDDSLEGVDYVICKDKPYKIRKSVRDNVHREPDDAKFNVCD